MDFDIWSSFTSLPVTTNNLIAKAFNLPLVVKREIGRYNPGRVGSFSDLSITTTVSSLMDCGRVPSAWASSKVTITCALNLGTKSLEIKQHGEEEVYPRGMMGEGYGRRGVEVGM